MTGKRHGECGSACQTDRMRPPRLGLLLASTAIAALALTGCTSGGVGSGSSPQPSETRSSEELLAQYGEDVREERLITPDVAPPTDPTLTPAGTPLALGDWAVVPQIYEPDNESWVIATRPAEVREGDLEVDFADFPEQDVADLGDVVPYYLDVQFSHLTGEKMRLTPISEFRLVLSDGSTASSPLVTSGSGNADTSFCESAAGASDIPERPGDVFEGCQIYLVPSELTIASIDFVPRLTATGSGDTISWTP